MPLADTSVEPTVRVPVGWTSRFTLLWFGFWMAWLVPVQLVLPNQFAALDSAHKVRDFGITNGAAGVVALIALPLAGALCDRTRSRWGRRRVWMAAGVVVLALSIAALGPQRSWVGVMTCWMFASLGFSIASAGLFAAVADQVPVAQRGIISGAIFGPQAAGLLIGLVLLALVITGTASGYLVLAVAVLILSVPFVLRYRESPPATALLYVTAIYLVFTLITTYGGGVLSDRTGRCRVFVAIASVLQGIAAVLLVIWPSFSTTLIAGAFLGAGYGAFLSVDQALVTQVLPDAETRAKDLGIMNIGNNVPQALAPVAAALIIDQLGGYRVLFAFAGIFTFLGATMVYRIRSIR